MSEPLECHEEVSRNGEAQPCDKTAVAMRLDPTFGSAYPVCAYHSRAPMVSLSELKADAIEEGIDVARSAIFRHDTVTNWQSARLAEAIEAIDNPYREVSA